MKQLNARVRDIEMPPSIRQLPISDQGFPVPWFVFWSLANKPCQRGLGVPDFRIIMPGAVMEAHHKQRCWICGQRRGAFGAFVIGPMCAVNRLSSEPPSHMVCARYAVKACPFLAQPRMVRNDKGLPEERCSVAGMILRNPGVALVWVTRSYRVHQAEGGVLFRVGEPHDVSWWAQGREATRAEILASIDTGLPELRRHAEEQRMAHELPGLIAKAMKLVPPEARPLEGSATP